MLVTLKEILQIAENRKIAVGAFNAANLESLAGQCGGGGGIEGSDDSSVCPVP